MKKDRYRLESNSKIPRIGQERINDIKISKLRIRSEKYRSIRKRFFIAAITFFIIILIAFAVMSGGGMICASLSTQTSTECTVSTQKNETTRGDVEVFVPVTDKSEETTAEKETAQKTDIYFFDYSMVPNGHTAIIPMDLSKSYSGVANINNLTGLIPDVEGLLSSRLDVLRDSEAPQILIIHTHATEAYSDDGAISFPDNGSEIARSDDRDRNVVSLGALMSDILNEAGISTVHCGIMHDSIQYMNSYDRAKATIEEYLNKYPSIRLVIDVHRDDIVRSTGELIRPVTLVDFECTAQIKLSVGSEWGGEECPNWQKNLALALKLCEWLNVEHPKLCRPTELRPYTYNQELAPYSLTLEIGSCGNSLKEAERGAKLVAHALCDLLKN